MSQKNLVIFHLESVSNQMLHQYASELSVTSRLMQQSISFRRFFSSATSTYMALSDVIRGESFSMDAGVQYHDFRTADYQENLVSILSGQGYGVYALLGKFGHVKDPAKLAQLAQKSYITWPQKRVTRRLFNSREELNAVLAHAAAKPPFFVYLHDVYSHMVPVTPEKKAAPDMQLYVAEAYRHLDKSVEWLLTYLGERGLWENTLIVGFGDHGDSLYSHGFQHGMCHGEPPYCPMCWTPCFIHDGSTIGVYENVASLVDLRSTILPKLGLPDHRTFEWGGINLLAQTNDVVFSQNLYANQIEKSALLQDCDWDKGFSVMNNLYQLVATRRGMELYAYLLDPGNACNLLHFFELDHDGNIFRYVPPASLAMAKFVHFHHLFKPPYVQAIVQNFQYLKATLMERLALKERLVERLQPVMYNKFDMTAFNKARKRDDYDW